MKTIKLLAALGIATATATAAAEKPNIILIMVDDMGFSDIRPYGGEIDTPNLDSLAKNGLRFTQFYNSARCCPTRATLLTGLHPHQAGIGHMTGETAAAGPDKAVPPAYAGNLNEACVTLAQVARSAGYATFMTGKWHLSGKDEADWPLQRGFDRYYGCLSGATHHFQPYDQRIMYDGNNPDPEPKSTTSRPFYTTDAFTDHAIRFIDEHKTGPGTEKPFFLYLAYTAPHWPIHAHDQEIAKYRGKYKSGWDQLREQRYQRQIASGLIPAAWKMTPRDPEVPAWESLDESQRDQCDHRMAAYAAMIDRVDQKIGDLLATLKKHDAFDNTLILFLSDNGACAEVALLGEGDPVKDRAPNTPLTRPALGKAWANACNTPYRLYKHFAHEGGANTPFIAHWPARIKPGRDWFRQPAQLIDVMATVVDLTGAHYPETLDGRKILPIDGIPLTPAFDGKPLERKSPVFIEHENNASVRDGDWKLVGREVSPPRGLQKQKWELYNLKADGTELNDLAKVHPEKVESMSAQWEAWAKRVGVFPKPGAARPARPKSRAGNAVAAVDPAMSRAEIEAGLKSHDRALHIKEGWIRDPYITRGPEDFFYLTGTTINADDSRERTDPYNVGLGTESAVGDTVRLWKSKDLIDWEPLGVIFDLKQDSAFKKNPGKYVWAPEIHWIPEMKRWVLLHCPKQKSNLALSAGEEPKGPWTHPLGTGFGGHHDPSIFKDGNTWWVLSENTEVQPLAADFSRFTAPATRIDPSGERTNSEGRTLSVIGHEGATMIKVENQYVHLGTAWSTDQGRKGSYNLYYCTSDKINGSYGPRKFAGRFLGHGTPFQTRDGKWWCTAFFNANVPPLPRAGIEQRDLSETAQTINRRGTTIVPLDVKLLDNGEVYIRAKDPAYATPGPDEVQKF
jgi:arylsulfatase